MRRNPDRLTTGAVLCFASLVLSVLGLAACSDGGGSSPTAPPPPAAAGSASVSGQVTGVSGSGAGAVGAAGVGVTVRIQGTSLSTTTDAAGRFDLGGVPEGDQVVLFETATASAPLPIHGIESGEQIDLVVALDGSTVQVQSMSRSKGGGDPPELGLEFQPDTWNVNWANSSGTVSALIRGDGFEEIDLDSIVLIGSDAGAEPLAPTRAERRGNHVRAFFAQSEAIAVLDDPRPGEVHEVTIELTVGGGEPFTLTATVRIVGPGGPGGGDASIDLEKATEGQDADRAPGPSIPVGDPVSWTYVVTNTGEVPLTGVTIGDDQGVDVDCPADALEPGESMTCTGSGTAEAGQYRNVGTAVGVTPEGDEVDDEDPSHYFGEEEEPEPVDLTVEMQPASWNTNWSGSGGTVSALIRGSGFEDIDLDSIVLVGSDPGADPLVPTRVDRQGNHVRAFFAKSDAIEILDSPAPGEVHTLTVELTVAGEPVSLTTDVRVVGPPA